MRKYLNECGPITWAFVGLCVFFGSMWQAFYA